MKSSQFLIVVIPYSYHSLAKREICGNFSRPISRKEEWLIAFDVERTHSLCMHIKVEIVRDNVE